MEFRIGNVEAAIIEDLENKKESTLVKRVLKNNMIYKHNNKDACKKKFICELENCNNEYEVTIIHNHFLYPRFCKEHRNAYKREMHLLHNSIKKKDNHSK